jgi:hypothetical protein
MMYDQPFPKSADRTLGRQEGDTHEEADRASRAREPGTRGSGDGDGLGDERHRLLLNEQGEAGESLPRSTRCSTCNSPDPRWHPATQSEGEVSWICDDPFHEPLTELERALLDQQSIVVLGKCPHGVDLDREFCPKGCRV